MANHKSSEKRARQDKVKRMTNKTKKASARTAVKAVRTAIVAGDKTTALDALKKAQSKLMKVAKSPALTKKAAARKISRLTKQVASLTK
ncbi:MAG: 30S ribosomal protein S20 [Bacteriovoracia bacterium]